MSDEITTPDELTILKKRATSAGLSYSPNIGVDSLRKKLNDHLNDDPAEDEVEPVITPSETKGQRRARLRKEASKLIRVRISCMNPNKAEHEGEIFTVSNSAVGTFKKFVPFGTEFHVPQMILTMIGERKYQQFYTVKENGESIRKGRLVKEFAIEVLKPLTAKEIQDIAHQQAISNNQ